MANKIKLFIVFFILALSFISLYSKAATCPPIETIARVAGENRWQTTEPGWSGYFVAPITGKGRSYTVKRFMSASWVKSHDTADSAGFVQCDYIGDFGFNKADSDGKNYEVIRFTQDESNSALAPSASNWTCQALTKFPQEACNCYSNVTSCNFRFG